jgi:hypothetical protein
MSMWSYLWVPIVAGLCGVKEPAMAFFLAWAASGVIILVGSAALCALIALGDHR